MLSDMIKTWTFVVLFACMAYGQKKPPNYRENEMPDTSFSCKDKIVGGYYADPETSCQMFHVCVSVAGTGVEDFRFLCPNNTVFDQENQICDDWYNIDCEAATLYYSDNFDLYRLGSKGASAVASSKATPIPLGPSSASPKVQQPPKSRKPSLSAPVNNAVSENDDDYYLQRSDATDSKLQHDLLRGSSSSDFFSNKNRGVETPDDYEDVRVASSKDVPKKNTKAPFRKLLTGKKPVAESSADASSTTETLQRTAGTTTTVRQPNYKPTTYRSKDRGRVNYKTYLDKQTKADEYDFQKVPKPAATVTQSTTFAPASSSSYQPTTVRATNGVYQTTQQIINSGVRAYTQVNANNPPKTQDFLRVAPINNNNNNNNNNNLQAINAIQGFRPANNVNQNFQQNANFNQGNFQSEKIFTTTTQRYNQNPTTNVYQTDSFQQQQRGSNTFQSGNTFQPSNTFQPINTFQSGNTFQPSNTFQPGNTFQPFQTSNTFQPDNQFQNGHSTTQKYNTYQSPTAYQQTANAFQSSTPYNAGNSFQQQQQQQQTSQQSLQFQSTTERFSKDYKAKFDPYNSYHQRSNEEAGETLKTASSTNLRPSDLNALLQPKPKSINATLSVGYSFNKADGGVAKSTVVVPAPTTQKPRPFTTQPVAVTTRVAATASSSPSSTTVFVGAQSSTKKPTVTKDKDSSYDYAYYDDSNHNDYTDVVPEDFSRIHNVNSF